MSQLRYINIAVLLGCLVLLVPLEVDADALCGASTTVSNGKVFAHPYFAIIACYPGYYRQGNGVVRCDRNGKILGPLPTCIKEQEINRKLTLDVDAEMPGRCGANTHIANGKVFPYQSYAEIACNPGYSVNGTSFVLCDIYGHIQDLLPTCIKKAICGANKVVRNGQVSPHPTYATISCDPGYHLKGNAKIVCDDSGILIEFLPFCLRSSINFNDQHTLNTFKKEIVATLKERILVGVFEDIENILNEERVDTLNEKLLGALKKTIVGSLELAVETIFIEKSVDSLKEEIPDTLIKEIQHILNESILDILIKKVETIFNKKIQDTLEKCGHSE